ncbi:unnamed protein product [Paramecium pentaurelia]|uniref:Uncharacterized protein n=1 Tax=Paramecium pentaurelia TaxID=43138 RepID=A0A8S1VWE5_9CILI|nr:unnamed protein product [Paramecium pentaurelia]CAD8181660.1 unnamed protein product [Paramecium pentaurelia]
MKINQVYYKDQQRIMERKQKQCICIVSFLININNFIDSYNAVYSTRMMTEYCSSVVAFDNQAIQNVIDNQTGLDYVVYNLLNNVIAQVISIYTGIRGHKNTCNNMMFSNMFSYPSLHFLIPSYGSKAKDQIQMNYKQSSLQKIDF